jgi:chemotaxis protein CheX
MDVALINPFLSAAMSLFDQMFDLSATPGAPFILDPKSAHRWEITGLLGVTGDYQGIICFRLHRILADKMLAKSGVETNGEEERLDMANEMVGELTNIISGNAAGNLPDCAIEVSPPAVIIGENHMISWPRSIPIIGIPFTTQSGPFEVDVCFRRNATPRPKA